MIYSIKKDKKSVSIELLLRFLEFRERIFPEVKVVSIHTTSLWQTFQKVPK